MRDVAVGINAEIDGSCYREHRAAVNSSPKTQILRTNRKRLATWRVATLSATTPRGNPGDIGRTSCFDGAQSREKA